MTEKYIKINNLSVSVKLFEFINKEAIPGTEIKESEFWYGFDKALHYLALRNKEILEIRRKFQIEIDRWHLINKNKNGSFKNYKSFLEKIG